jgi:hypothetical protein
MRSLAASSGCAAPRAVFAFLMDLVSDSSDITSRGVSQTIEIGFAYPVALYEPVGAGGARSREELPATIHRRRKTEMTYKQKQETTYLCAIVNASTERGGRVSMLAEAREPAFAGVGEQVFGMFDPAKTLPGSAVTREGRAYA